MGHPFSASEGRSFSKDQDTATEDHPSRRQLQRDRREQLRRVVEQFDRVSIEDYMNMVIAHYYRKDDTKGDKVNALY